MNDTIILPSSRTLSGQQAENIAAISKTDSGEYTHDAEWDEDFLGLSADDNMPTATDFYTTRNISSKYPDWPMINIKDVHENDVLFGRGGG
jgi:hypothetical protein